jgi:DNA end-binding protein Ku
MPPRPTWKGFLKVSLVNIPVKVFPATESAAVLAFNQLHAECQTRIQQKRWCPHCEREVSNAELAKGFEFEKGSLRRCQRRGYTEGAGRIDPGD